MTNTLTPSALPVIPVQSRSERLHSVRVADFPAVTGREVGWRYSPVAALAPLLTDPLDGSRPAVEVVAGVGATASWVSPDHPDVGAAGCPEDRASANAWSHAGEVFHLALSGAVTTPVTVTRVDLGSSPRALHTVVRAAPEARATVVIAGRGSAALAENVEIVVGAGADLTVVSVQEWDDDAIHCAAHFAVLERDARLTHTVVSLGGRIVRVNPSVRLAGDGSDVAAYGVSFADAGQHLEHQVFVHHEAPHTRSRVTYKGALRGGNARTVWIGDVLIGREATGTDSYEQNRNLVLSDGARADSVPNLEIETGDIVGAGHASATGRFDDEQLFYLMARGIPETEARRLVVRGFLIDILTKIPVPELAEHLLGALDRELEAS